VSRARLVLVRHAQPADGGVVLPLDEVGLGETGREQAALLARSLEAADPEALYSSPMPRALETVRPLAELFAIEPEIVPGLRELDFGDLRGVPLKEIELRYPDFLGWTAAPSGVSFPGGESVRSLSGRAVEAARGIARAHPDGAAIVVCHGVVIRAVLADALAMPLDSIFRFHVPYCSVSVIDWFGDRPLVRSINGLP
jgi:broad specificity phosphatase PhoE